jgi:hypothetical protein
VDRRATASLVVIVHRGEIIVHERVGVQHLDRGSRGHRLRARSATRFASSDQHRRTQPLARARRRVTHRLDEAAGILGAWRQPAREVLVDRRSNIIEERLQLGRRARRRERRHGVRSFVSVKGATSIVPLALTRISTRFSALASSC